MRTPTNLLLAVARYGYWGVQNRQWQVWNATESKWIFSPAKQTQLAKLFGLSTPKKWRCQKISAAFGSYWCTITAKHRERRRSSRMAIFQIAKGRLRLHMSKTHIIYETVETCTQMKSELFSCIKSVNVTAHLKQDWDLISAKKVENPDDRGSTTKICQTTLFDM